jgi:hypothetical protein
MVPRAGLEPAHPKARDFKSLVSTDFTIWADGFFTALPVINFKTTLQKMEAGAGIEPASADLQSAA